MNVASLLALTTFGASHTSAALRTKLARALLAIFEAPGAFCA